ncbi:MAG: hydroxyacylglutathione hydrolase [Legionellales bacterium]|nr:hydroxyacylglutathione hydrolase [Legionellales bacterium]|tara:strand:+ start:3618 stop:4388 length:771 start_codon:yes stop_codon:yes gene_type:complete
MVDVVAIPALSDNYIWLLVDRGQNACAAVDPGQAEPVLEYIAAEGLHLTALLITHHHWDHTNGIPKIHEQHDIPIYGPMFEQIRGVTHGLEENTELSLDGLGVHFRVINTPGHTDGQIAYYGGGMVFTGDTLFSGGCGRLFEGTPAQMHNSLHKLANLPDDTLLYCGHEYTLKNLEFAKLVEPDNAAIDKRIVEVKALREQGLPSLPSTMGVEKQTNPFLRCHVPAIQQAAMDYAGEELVEDADVFAAIRQWKDNF